MMMASMFVFLLLAIRTLRTMPRFIRAFFALGVCAVFVPFATQHYPETFFSLCLVYYYGR